MFLCNRQNSLNLLFIVNLQHQFRVQTVERSISPVGKSADWVGELTGLGNKICFKGEKK